MKRLKLHLLAALALPTAVHAETIFLTCNLFNDNGKQTNADLSLNESQEKLTYYYPIGGTWTVPAKFTKKSIFFNERNYVGELDRTNGNFYYRVFLSNGSLFSTYEGKCKKEKKSKTLF